MSNFLIFGFGKCYSACINYVRNLRQYLCKQTLRKSWKLRRKRWLIITFSCTFPCALPLKIHCNYWIFAESACAAFFLHDAIIDPRVVKYLSCNNDPSYFYRSCDVTTGTNTILKCDECSLNLVQSAGSSTFENMFYSVYEFKPQSFPESTNEDRLGNSDWFVLKKNLCCACTSIFPIIIFYPVQ